MQKMLSQTILQFIGLVLRLGIQAIAFIFFARLVGAESFGSFSAIMSIILTIGPLVELGASQLILSDHANNLSIKKILSESLVLVILTAPFGIFAIFLIKTFFFSSLPLEFGLFLALGNFVGIRLISINYSINLALGLQKSNILIDLCMGISQIGSVFVASMFNSQNLSVYSISYFIFLTVLGIILTLISIKKNGFLSPTFINIRNRAHQGVNFALATAAVSATDLDKALLEKLSNPYNSGIFTVAHRFVVLVSLPLTSFLMTTLPRFFLAGTESGLRSTRKLFLKILPYTVSYGGGAALAIYLSADLIARVFGSDFKDTSFVIRSIAPLILLQSIQLPLLDVLSGSGYQKIRTGLQFTHSISYFLLCVVFIPSGGWLGVINAIFIVHLSTILIAFVAIFIVPEQLFLKFKSRK